MLFYKLFAVVSVATLACSSFTEAGTISLTGGTYSQDFNALIASGTSNVLPAGWRFHESGMAANGVYTAATGSGRRGDTYSFGTEGSSDRALGMLRSLRLVPMIGAVFTNDTGQTLAGLEISYAGEQWSLGQENRGPDSLSFEYSLDARSLYSGTWIRHTDLDFHSPVTTGPVGALNGNDPANRTVVNGAIAGLAIAPGASFMIRWRDYELSGMNDGLAVDDFTLRPFAVPTPTALGGGLLLLGILASRLRFRETHQQQIRTT